MSIPADAGDGKPVPVLTVNLGHGNINEVYMLNPHERFPFFGGSRRGLVVGKTASLIIRERSPNTTRDAERDITSEAFWAWIAKLINSSSGKARASINGEEPMFETED